MYYVVDRENTDPVWFELAELDLFGGPHLSIPLMWLNHLKKGDKVYMAAALVLAEITYWYRPIWQEKDGRPERGKQFEGDLLHIRYDRTADKLGLTKRQVQEAIYWLKGQGLIVVELRDRLIAGRLYNNLTYVWPVPDAIKAISFPDSRTPLSHSNGTALSHSNGTPSHIKKGHITDPIHTELPSTEDAAGPVGQPQDATRANTNASQENAKKGPLAASGGPSAGESDHQKLMRLYQEALGYKIPHGGKEAAGAKKLLARYTVDDALGCYRWLKSDPWWADKHLSLQNVAEQIGPWIKLGRPATKTANGRQVGPQVVKMTVEEAERLQRRALKKLGLAAQ